MIVNGILVALAGITNHRLGVTDIRLIILSFVFLLPSACAIWCFARGHFLNGPITVERWRQASG